MILLFEKLLLKIDTIFILQLSKILAIIIKSNINKYEQLIK